MEKHWADGAYCRPCRTAGPRKGRTESQREGSRNVPTEQLKGQFFPILRALDLEGNSASAARKSLQDGKLLKPQTSQDPTMNFNT